MGRSRLIALLVIVVFVGGLVAVRYNPDGGTTTEAVSNNAAGANPALSETAEPELIEPELTEPETTEKQTKQDLPLGQPPELLGPALGLEGIDAWLHTNNESLSDFDGQVKIVQFWTYSCHNCTATLPFLKDIYAKHQADGLEIIGVHSPEFDFEKDPAGVAQASKDLGVVWPVALDTDKKNFHSWQGDRRFWPRTYVVDQVGNIRYDRIGEGGYDELDQTVTWLLENGP